MKAVIAIDSFKGSITSMQAGNAAAQGIRRVYPEANTVVIPLADGGEGTVDAISSGLDVKRETVQVRGPLGDTVSSTYCVMSNGTAIMEVASAAGLTLVPADKQNPLYTTTWGIGDMILDAIGKGYRTFIIGLGGSATNDGGIGMLQALGYTFTDTAGRSVSPCAVGLRDIASVSAAQAHPLLAECSFQVACDVTNPLCGENGCSAVYGPQKGATPATVAEMDAWMGHYAAVVKGVYPASDAKYPGSGAAGGLGFAFRTFLGATLENGVELLLRAAEFDAILADADIVLTGEGRMDHQTAMGKAPSGVAKSAKKQGRPVLAFCGCASRNIEACHRIGIDAVFPIVRGAIPLREAMQPETAMANMSDTVEQVFRLIHRMQGTSL